VSSQNFTIEYYKNDLLTGASLYGNRTMFRSKAHKITTVKVNKTKKNAIVEYLDYQIPVTQLNRDMQVAKRY